MSAIGGSMFPRFLMPDAMQKAGLWTINAWAIDGFHQSLLARSAGDRAMAAGLCAE
jgi:ABC-type multidrug transport system permease subunit